MNVHLPMTTPRLAFFGVDTEELQVPSAADWAEVRFFSLSAGWDACLQAAADWAPTHSIVFAGTGLDSRIVSALPGIRIAVLTTPVAEASLTALRRLCQPELPQGFRWVTTVDSDPSTAGGLPLLQTLPPSIDTSRFSGGPRTTLWKVLVPSWARPDESVLEHVRRMAPVEFLPDHVEGAALLPYLERTGVLLYSTRDLLGRFDPLPLLALASGHLVMSITPFPADWNIEPEDELLVREPHAMVSTLDDVLQSPEIYKAVRIRAWQKMRECFDASAMFKRLVHDAQLFSDLPGHLTQLTQSSKPTPVEAAGVTRLPSRKRAVSK
jgi:hypothetical protein